MPRMITCSSCGAMLSLGEAWTHPKAKCTACNAVIDVPPANEKTKPQLPRPAPQATETPPQATPTNPRERSAILGDVAKHRKIIIAAIAAIFGGGFLFGCCGASLVYWALPRGQGILGADIKGAAQNIAGDAPKDEMTFQELEDRLNAAGLKVSRVQSRTRPDAMWFGDEAKYTKVVRKARAGFDVPDEVQFDPDGMAKTIAFWENAQMPNSLLDGGLMLVTKKSSSKDAKDCATKIVDIQGRSAFSWGPFVFESNQETIARARAALIK